MGTVVQLDMTAQTYRCAECEYDAFHLIKVAEDIRVVCGNKKCLTWVGDLRGYERDATQPS